MTIGGRRIVIAGGSGFLGTLLAQALVADGDSVVVLSRQESTQDSGAKTGFREGGSILRVTWDGRRVGRWVETLDGCDALVNLAGRTVDCIKTPDHCDEILRSRVESTRVLGLAMRRVNRPPPVWVQMSTAHIYGDPPSARIDEDSAFGLGLAPMVGRRWEEAFEESKLQSQRGVVLRTSFVIGKDRGAGGGALGTLRRITRLGAGGTVGRGTQGMSWLHERDFISIVRRGIEDPSMTGPYIVSSPTPVSQKEFMRTLRRVLRVPIGLPAAEWMVRLAAPLVMRTDPELVLYGRWVIPQRLIDEGFEFEFEDLQSALIDLCR